MMLFLGRHVCFYVSIQYNTEHISTLFSNEAKVRSVVHTGCCSSDRIEKINKINNLIEPTSKQMFLLSSSPLGQAGYGIIMCKHSGHILTRSLNREKGTPETLERTILWRENVGAGDYPSHYHVAFTRKQLPRSFSGRKRENERGRITLKDGKRHK